MSYWKDKDVCVTGGGGFLGSFIVEKLKERGVKGIAVPRSENYNLTDQIDVHYVLSLAKPDIVIHCAALSGGIGANRDRPAEFFYKNLMVNTMVMHEAYLQEVGKFVGIGTVCSYPKFATVPFVEESLWDGYPEETNAPYGLAKKMMIVQAEAYRKQYGFNAINLLPTNLYGPRDNDDPEDSHVIMALIQKFHNAKLEGVDEVELWGDGTPTRDFLYVEDAAEGILLAAEHYNESMPVNLGSGVEVGIGVLAMKIARLVGYEGEITWDVDRPNGQPRRLLDVTRAQKFGFSAMTRLEEGLEKTIEWWRSR